MKYTLRKKGRPYKFRARNTIIALSVVWAIAMLICLKAQDFGIKLAMANYYEAQEAGQSAKVKELAEQNQALREKLESSARIKVDDKTKELVRFYIKKYFGNASGEAEKVFTCESGLAPNAYNGKNTNGSVDRGVPQINSVHAKRFETMYGIKYELGAHDIDISMKYAKFLYDHSGWNPWVCSKVLANK